MKLLAALAPLLALAAASPVEVSPREEGSLVKRDTEILYLINCRVNVACCNPEKHSSKIAVSPGASKTKNCPVCSNLVSTVLRCQRPVAERRGSFGQQPVHR